MKRIATLVVLVLVALTLAGCPRQIDPTVLVLYGGAVGETHDYYANAVTVLANQGIETVSRFIESPPVLSVKDHAYYAAIVITDYNAYANLSISTKETIDEYCREFDVGQYFVYVGSGTSVNDGQVKATSGMTLSDARVEAASPVLDITRDGGVVEGDLPWYGRLLNVEEGTGYQPVAYATGNGSEGANILLDAGDYDGIRRVFYGHDFRRFWLHDLLYLDAVQWLAATAFPINRERRIGVDIDDIFQPNYDADPALRVAKIQAEDVEAVIDTQEFLSSIMEGTFRFHLGFNIGFYEETYGPPPYDDIAGDHALVENRDQFYWFDHLPNHPPSSNYNTEELIAMMEESKTWATSTGVIDYMTRYQLSPYHDGIYPVHEPLYEAWRTVWDARYTSTTTIASGFENNGILVAPRQSCGIWSSQYSWDQVSQEGIDASIEGGALFRTILEKPVAVFMTHQSNYARDMVGLYLFEELVLFFDQWTNFELIAGADDELIEEYFRLYPM